MSDNTVPTNGASDTTEPAASASTPHSNKSGWDGKLRVNKQATLANPEALSDPEYSDEDAPPVDEIEADEDLLDDEDPDVEASKRPRETQQFGELTCRKLGLRQNFISSIELPTCFASTLEELELYDNLLKHMGGLEEFTELNNLDLSYNKFTRIKHLENLKKLEYVYFVQNRISKIEGLDELTELKYLELGANRIREIAGLEKLEKLEQLWLGQNKITELKGLSMLHNLRTLSIQANRLDSLSGIEALPNLTELYVSDNRIPSLEPLAAITKLDILDFQSNPIKSLAGLERLNLLENVWASNCQIDSFQEIERVLKDKEKLEEVYFEGNPVQKQGPVLYRNKVKLALPQLIKIDAAYVKTT
ncbi:hypothetical protein MBLNU230_g7881t1 [Neophaeotheca triangularis]